MLRQDQSHSRAVLAFHFILPIAFFPKALLLLISLFIAATTLYHLSGFNESSPQPAHQLQLINKPPQAKTTVKMNDSDGFSTFSDPEVVRVHENPSDFSLGDSTLVAQRDNGMQNARTLIYEELAEKMHPSEDLELVVRGFEKRVDEKVRATFFDGIRAREVSPGAVEPKIGMTFMAGADKSQVTQLEQMGMAQRQPEQKDAAWRVNTAGTLLLNYEVEKDLSFRQTDNTATLVQNVRERRVFEDGPMFHPSNPQRALATPKTREDRTVTIDSDNVEIVDSFAPGDWDLESTLIELDGQSLIGLIVNYRHLIHRGGPALTSEETIKLLDVMIEDARRLCVRSPILFRMSTRRHIITSKNTRYGIDDGTMFRTLTTSRGIKNIISLSAAYFNSLPSSDGKDKAQEMIRPRFLQMLVLLLSLLNNDDLGELAEFLESTYGIKADRRDVELLILKVLPLSSINSKIFINGLVDAFEGSDITRDLTDQAHVWNFFVQRLLLSGYIIPAGVEDLGQDGLSWVVKWPKDGIKDARYFNQLQYAGVARTLNDIPPMDLHIDSDTEEKTVELTNGEKYIVGSRDYEKIVKMVQGKYSVTDANNASRNFDLEISEEYLNESLYDAILSLNRLINNLNGYLASHKPKTIIRTLANMRIAGDRSSGTNPFQDVKGSGRLTRHVASLNGEYLAIAYKVEGKQMQRRDLFRLLTGDIRRVTGAMQAIEQAMVKLDNPGASGEVRSNIRKLRQDLKLIGLKVAHAGDLKISLQRVPQATELGDEPVTKTLAAASAESSANVVWNDYKVEYAPAPENVLYVTAQRRTVGSVLWLSDEIVEVGLIDVASKYIASPLKPVSIEERGDEIHENDEVLLVGQYLVLIEREEGSNMEIMLNWLKITDMEKHKVTRRGMNRRKVGALVTTAIR